MAAVHCVPHKYFCLSLYVTYMAHTCASVDPAGHVLLALKLNFGFHSLTFMCSPRTELRMAVFLHM